MSGAAETVLTADCIGKRFGERKVLSAATVHADRGVVTALIGWNGCGKSTLLRIMAGLMAPDHGIVRFREDVYTLSRAHAANFWISLAQRGT